MKWVFWGLGLLVALIVAVGAYLVLESDSLLKDGIETYGPQYLGADVEVRSVALSLAEGSGEVRGLRIGNPQGFDGADAMRLGRIKLVLDPNRLSQELVVLKAVEIDGAELGAIVKGKSTNLQRLLDNVSAAAGLEDEPGPEMRVIIDRLSFTNAKAAVSSDLVGDFVVDIPDVHLKDIGRASNGVTMGQAVKQLMDPVIKNVTRALVARGVGVDADSLRSGLKDKIGDKLEGGLKSLTERLGR